MPFYHPLLRVNMLDVCGVILHVQQNPYHQRRMSDPSQTWSNFLRGSFKTSGIRKSRSETENVDSVGANGCTEVEAGNIEDGGYSYCLLCSWLIHSFVDSVQVFCIIIHNTMS